LLQIIFHKCPWRKGCLSWVMFELRQIQVHHFCLKRKKYSRIYQKIDVVLLRTLWHYFYVWTQRGKVSDQEKGQKREIYISVIKANWS
jgi:hypothetical protein